ncbi:MAG TPA: deoxyribonuclease V [Anaerolineae bacterium]|nr:deoxyribonuclease V [Anaerolineae bacterium]
MLHDWSLTPEEAIQVQAELRTRLNLTWDDLTVETIGGVDVDLEEDIARAAIVILRLSDLKPIEGVTADVPLVFPYIPGLLAFREGPAVLAAWEKVQHKPDVVMFDGQGIAHPRGIGIAAQMGLWIERPTIGVAKSRLYGRHEIVGPRSGNRVDLRDEHDPRRIIGAVLRTREGTNPLYISPGHLIDVPHAIDLVLRCVTHFRLPEPTRWAHKFAAGTPLPLDEGLQPRLL